MDSDERLASKIFILSTIANLLSSVFLMAIIFVINFLIIRYIGFNWPNISFLEAKSNIPKPTALAIEMFYIPMSLTISISLITIYIGRVWSKRGHAWRAVGSQLLSIIMHYLIVWFYLLGCCWHCFYDVISISKEPSFTMSGFFATLAGFFPMSFLLIVIAMYYIVAFTKAKQPSPNPKGTTEAKTEADKDK